MNDQAKPGPRYCQDCQGTGADAEKTRRARRSGQCDQASYIRCWTCNGSGLDPAEYFRWGDHPPLCGVLTHEPTQ